MDKKIVFLFLCVCIHCFSKEKPAILVTGGAGYIGTQTCKALEEAGFVPIVYDNLCKGHKEAVRWGILEIGDISDRDRLEQVIQKYRPLAVMHLAALKAVGESMKDPAKYYLNNVAGSLILLDVLHKNQIDKVVFSSSAATYAPSLTQELLKETDPIDPINTYGTTKWMIEKVLKDFDAVYGLKYVILRYFNAAGADLLGECGERGETPGNLVPILMRVASGKRPAIEIFGTDYATVDGFCIRDFVHVVDLAEAHLKALKYLLNENPSVVLNIGNAKGVSVREVLEEVRKHTQKPIPAYYSARRAGDPPHLVAQNILAKKILGWQPKYSDLPTIVETEWQWAQKLESQFPLESKSSPVVDEKNADKN